MSTTAGSDARARVAAVEERLQPRLARSWAIDELNDLFASGTPPEPALEGFMRGRPITLTVSEALDVVGRRFAALYMPWLGKSFERDSARGVNVFAKSVRLPMRAIWPSYVPERELADRIEAFPFATRVAPGTADPDVRVLAIDYDIEPNPPLLIRSVLDELVQLDDALYLGKVFVRRASSYRHIGFFTLER